MISEPNTYLLSPNYYNDERLAVIAEVDEKDQISEASLSCRESSNSLCQKLEQERRKISSDSTKTKPISSLALTPTAQKTSFIYQKGKIHLKIRIIFLLFRSSDFASKHTKLTTSNISNIKLIGITKN